MIYIRILLVAVFVYFAFVAIELYKLRVALQNVAGSVYNMDNRMND